MKYIELVKGLFTNKHEDRAKQADPYVSYSIEANRLMFNLILAPVESSANNTIWYTSSDDNVVTPYSSSRFGANVVSNTYENGKGAITFDGDVTCIGEEAFPACSTLTSITIPNRVESIENDAFKGFSSLTSVTINSDAVVSKVYSTSSNISKIFGSQVTEYIIGDSVNSIGDFVFFRCSSLTSVIIGSNVINIGLGSLANCKSLASINVEESNPNYGSIEGVLFNKDKTILIQCPSGKPGAYTLPNSVTRIDAAAFAYCSSLTSVVIPNGVTSVGECAFQDCDNLTSINIPNIVTNIENSVFYGCWNLNMVTYDGTK